MGFVIKCASRKRQKEPNYVFICEVVRMSGCAQHITLCLV